MKVGSEEKKRQERDRKKELNPQGKTSWGEGGNSLLGRGSGTKNE